MPLSVGCCLSPQEQGDERLLEGRFGVVVLALLGEVDLSGGEEL